MWLLVLKSRLFQIALTAILGALAASWAYWAGNRNGDRLARADERGKAAKALVEASDKYRAREVEHAKQIETIRLEHSKLEAGEAARDRVVASDIGSGAKRVRVRVSSCPDPAKAGTASTGTDARAEAELPAEVGTRLYGIAADADATARQLAALQVWAMSAVKLCNGGTK